MHDDFIKNIINESIAVQKESLRILEDQILDIAHTIYILLQRGSKILICGNGGSAAETQHFSAELLNRFERERRALPAIALTADVATITAIANDYAYDEIFSKQVQALGNTDDILFVISTSGHAKNVIRAIEVALDKSMLIIALTGKDGGKIGEILSVAWKRQHVEIRVPSFNTARIQEAHLLIIHCICSLIDRYMID